MDAIGLISGTSMDGIDTVLARLTPEGDGLRAETLDFLTLPYPPDLLAALRRAAAGESLTAGELGALHVEVGEAFAAAALTLLGRPPAASLAPVAVIGSHGQTVAHDPERAVSVQLGSAAIIAERTGLPVVSDFRARDLAAGGQGAPIVPFVDHLLFADPSRMVAVLNLGGIANLTLLPPGAGAGETWAFDTGPANMVIDGLIRRQTGGEESIDRDGRRARRGHISPELLAELLADPYFVLRPPKSTGSETFGETYVDRLLAAGVELQLGDDDLIATATALTVETIVRALAGEAVERLVVAGGGVHNTALMDGFRSALSGVQVVTSDHFGIDPDAREAVSFAVLAWAHLEGRAAGLPGVTGACNPTLLGTLVPAGASIAGRGGP
jgi:anhydro-N-acetylmuramic acid kinase